MLIRELYENEMDGAIDLAWHVFLEFEALDYSEHLFALVCKDNTSGSITVNSSPFAVPVYHHLGFTDTDSEKVTNGLRYTPMVINLNNRL